jgi:hypothetical protein
VAELPASGKPALSVSSAGLGEFSDSPDAFAAASVDANPPKRKLPEPPAAAAGSATTLLGMFSMVAITNSPGMDARLACVNATEWPDVVSVEIVRPRTATAAHSSKSEFCRIE